MEYRKRWVFVSLILLALSVFVGLYIDQSMKEAAKKQGRSTLLGVSICLPHKKSGDVQTQECALGIKTNEGKYYSIADAAFFDTGVKIKVTGNIISPERDSPYNTDGTIEHAAVERR